MLGHKLLGPGATYGILKLFIPGPRTLKLSPAFNRAFLGPPVPDFPGSMKARGKFGTLGGLKGI